MTASSAVGTAAAPSVAVSSAAPAASASAEPALLTVDRLSVLFPTRSGPLAAVSEVSFQLSRGRTLALVGESGSGKSTIAKAVLGLLPSTAGAMTLAGAPLAAVRRRRSVPQKRAIQMVFQDPVSSLNPARTLREIVAEPAAIARVPRPERSADADRLMREVGLDPEQYGGRTSRQISGGQAQRIAIARALAARPQILLADEPVSGLDVSVQAIVLSTLRRLSRDHETALLFISHDMAVVRAISDDTAVLYLGRLCETGPTEQVLTAPAHPYTAALMAAVPEPGQKLGDPRILDAEPPSPLNPPPGCAFATRCPLATQRCHDERPVPVAITPVRTVACHYPLSATPERAPTEGAAP